jgi:hypothetical protein
MKWTRITHRIEYSETINASTGLDDYMDEDEQIQYGVELLVDVINAGGMLVDWGTANFRVRRGEEGNLVMNFSSYGYDPFNTMENNE